MSKEIDGKNAEAVESAINFLNSKMSEQDVKIQELERSIQTLNVKLLSLNKDIIMASVQNRGTGPTR